MIRVLLVPATNVSGAVKRAKDALSHADFKYEVADMKRPYTPELFDLVMVLGSDGQVLRTFNMLPRCPVPVLGVNDSAERSFLTECGVSTLPEALLSITRRKFEIEKAERLGVRADGHELPPALNEAALVSRRSATLIEYDLLVNGEEVWRDYGDGVIVATPIGSTAYSMSVGGPLVMNNTGVFILVSINSMDVTRRPTVVRNDAKILIEGFTSPKGCEVIVDGTLRVGVKKTLEVDRWPHPALIMRLSGSKTMDTMQRKIRQAEELSKMPPSAKLVLKLLEYEGPLTTSQIAKKSMLPDRTARMALSILMERGLASRRPTLRDARERLYEAK